MMTEAETRDQRRSRRKRIVRSKTINISRIRKSDIDALRAEYPEPTAHLRPRTRSECVNGARPCPFVSCRHNLYVDVSENGSIKFQFPDLEVCEMTESCALDVADKGEVTLEKLGEIMNLTRERARQIEMNALANTKKRLKVLNASE